MDDLVIRGGEVLDGRGSDAARGDVAIRAGRIASISARYSGTARRTIDVRGLVVAPGFIDIKTHSDFTLPYEEPHRYPAGIATTIVNGVVVVEDGRHTGARRGRVLRRGPSGVA